MKFCCLLAGCFAFALTDALAQAPARPGQLPEQPTVSDIRRGGRPGMKLPQTGWYFEVPPRPEFLDEQAGAIRFRLVVNAAGGLDSVTTVSSSVSARQETECRKVLQSARFFTNSPLPERAVGFYTFTFNVR